jgi:hypothetical protein
MLPDFKKKKNGIQTDGKRDNQSNKKNHAPKKIRKSQKRNGINDGVNYKFKSNPEFAGIKSGEVSEKNQIKNR